MGFMKSCDVIRSNPCIKFTAIPIQEAKTGSKEAIPSNASKKWGPGCPALQNSSTEISNRNNFSFLGHCHEHRPASIAINFVSLPHIFPQCLDYQVWEPMLTLHTNC